jgi:nicotinate-nucleotide adenylyltransferase
LADPVDPALVRLPPFQAGMRIGILGGSFDPAHEGHRAVSLVALTVLRLDAVWWLVSPHNPLKARTPADLGRRIAAARAVANDPRIKVTGVESALRTRYTADTLAALAPRLVGIATVWLMGADNLAEFHRWQRWRAIAARIPIAVFNRPGWAARALASPAAKALRYERLPERDASALPATPPPAWVFITRPEIDMSSTELRVRSGRSNATS